MSNKVVNVLSLSLKDENTQVRITAVKALLKIGTNDAIGSLKEFKDDEDVEIRNLIRRSLKSIESEDTIDVPIWNEHFADLDAANDEQKRFYDYWKSEIDKKNYIELGDNLSYIYAYAYSLIYDFIENEDIKLLSENFNKILEGYGHYNSVKKNIITWKSDAYLFIGNYKESLRLMGEIGFNIHNLEKYGFLKEDSLINGNVLINLKSNGLTDFGKSNKTKIAEVLDVYLNDYKDLYGKTIIQHFLEDYNLNYLIEEDFSNLKRFFDYEEEFNQLAQYYTPQPIDSLGYLNINYFDLLNLSEKDIFRLKNNLKREIYAAILNDDKRDYYRVLVNAIFSHNDSYKLKLWGELLEKDEFLKLKKDYKTYLRNDEFGSFYAEFYVDMINVFESYSLDELNKFNPIIDDIDIDHFYGIYSFSKAAANKRVVDKNVFGGVPRLINIATKSIPYLIHKAMEYEIKRVIREAENIYREEKDLPRVGEGWVSETELYYKIKEAFPNEKIVHHGKPSWLGLQHLDIYFPEKNVAIEYQGLQHNQPVDFFGGEESFKKNQERDQHKKDLCKKNNCALLYVYPEYDFENIKKEIEKIL